MRPLYESICERMTGDNPFEGHWDAHLHVMDGHNLSLDPRTRAVCFADILFKRLKLYETDSLIKLYSWWITDHQEEIDRKKVLLLATGLDSESVIKLYKSQPKGTFRGFGELKCYDRYGAKEQIRLKYKRLDWVRAIARFNEKECGCLPMYIHYTLNSPQFVERFRNMIEEFPDISFVLCHCGMDRGDQEESSKYSMDWTFSQVRDLMRDHGNLWADISWSAGEYFSGNPMKLDELPRDRLLIGSDMSPLSESRQKEILYTWPQKLFRLVDFDKNLDKLFNLSRKKRKKMNLPSILSTDNSMNGTITTQEVRQIPEPEL